MQTNAFRTIDAVVTVVATASDKIDIASDLIDASWFFIGDDDPFDSNDCSICSSPQFETESYGEISSSIGSAPKLPPKLLVKLPAFEKGLLRSLASDSFELWEFCWEFWREENMEAFDFIPTKLETITFA